MIGDIASEIVSPLHPIPFLCFFHTALRSSIEAKQRATTTIVIAVIAAITVT
jgi:hypothetical protein